MKTFIELSKLWRAKYKESFFFHVMLKIALREDLKKSIDKYLEWKKIELAKHQ